MSDKRVDWLALVVATISLGLSGLVFYYSDLRGPDIRFAVGHDVLIKKTTALGPRIGVICSFVNEGAKQTIITDAALDIDSPHITLPLGMVGDSFGGWEENGGVFKSSTIKYSLAAPIPVKGHDEAAVSFWFVPVSPFELTAGRHRFTLKAISQDRTWVRSFDIDISPTDITNMDKTPYADHPINVVNQE